MLEKSLISKKRYGSGQALVTLLFFAMMGMIIISAAAVILYTNISSLTTVEKGQYAYYTAESGIEEALLRLLRDPTFSAESLNVGDGSVSILVLNGLITSTGTYAGEVRKIQAQTTIDSNGIKITSWKEIN